MYWKTSKERDVCFGTNGTNARYQNVGGRCCIGAAKVKELFIGILREPVCVIVSLNFDVYDNNEQKPSRYTDEMERRSGKQS
jgi:hypothetical protein